MFEEIEWSCHQAVRKKFLRPLWNIHHHAGFAAVLNLIFCAKTGFFLSILPYIISGWSFNVFLYRNNICNLQFMQAGVPVYSCNGKLHLIRWLRLSAVFI